MYVCKNVSNECRRGSISFGVAVSVAARCCACFSFNFVENPGTNVREKTEITAAGCWIL